MAIYIDDRELVAAHKAGDSEAFDELVREHKISLIAHARRKLRCAAAAEDAFQETLVRAYRALPNFEGEYRLGPWLHRIMANVCIDEANRRVRDGEKTESFAAQPAARRHAPSPEDELGLHADDSQLDLALEGLPESQKEALLLRFVEDLDYEEVAAVSGVSEQNARARVSRARAAMRVALKGVAAFPALLIGLTKRGEKAAAAATGGSALVTNAAGSTVTSVAAHGASATAVLPTLAEASTAVAHAAPAAVPVVAKAAVGLGLAAAILTPTSDSALHLGAEAVSQPLVEQSIPATDLELSTQSVENNPVLSDGAVIDVNRETIETKISAAMQPAGNALATEAAAATTNQSEPLTVAADSTVEIVGAGLRFDFTGAGRYDVIGDLTILTGSSTYVATVDSISRLRLIPNSQDQQVMRAELLLSFVVQEWGSTDLRISGIVSDADTVPRFAGFFRSSTTENSAILDQGSVTGELHLSSPSSLALKLTP